MIENQPKSFGGDDVWVARLDSSTGDIDWLRHIGTSGKENLARNSGILADMDGNPVVYGDTTGELFRIKERLGHGIIGGSFEFGESDLFVVTLDKNDGSFAQTAEVLKTEAWAVVLVLTLLLCCCGFCCCRVRRNRRGRAGNAFFPEGTESDAEKEELVFSNGNYEQELVHPGRNVV